MNAIPSAPRLSPRRAELASFAHAYAVAVQRRQAGEAHLLVITTGDPLQPYRIVTELPANDAQILHEASAKMASTNRQITERVMQQAEDNAKQLFETLQAMASTHNPAEITKIYTDFLTASTQKHASQLLEMGQIMTRASQETWGPVADAIKAAATAKGR